MGCIVIDNMKTAYLGVLRQMIREVLVTEEAKGIASEGMGKLALTIIKGYPTHPPCRTYLLYDPAKLAELLSATKLTANAVYGVVMVVMTPDHPQWGAKEIEFTAARSGYGPMMYDIAMADVGGLIADRGSVSDDARGIWSFYKNKRPDVEKKQIDDYRNPSTKTKKDDGERHEEEPGDSLDYAYFLKNGPDVSMLKANHEAALPMLKKASKESGLPLDFAAIAGEFADQQYSGS